MKIKRTTDVLLEQDYMSIMWKQWLCWNNSNWLKDFQNEWQIDNKQFHLDSITMPGILPNQFLFPPQKRSANGNCRKHIFTVRTDQLLSLKLDQLTLFSCPFPPISEAVQVLNSSTVGQDNGKETPGLRGCAHKVPKMLSGTLVCLRTILTESGISDRPGK